MTHCQIGLSEGVPAWLSVEVERFGPIDSVQIYVYDPSGPQLGAGAHTIGEYEVWAGGRPGNNLDGHPTQCKVDDPSEPNHQGVPAVAHCGGVTAKHVLIRQLVLDVRLNLLDHLRRMRLRPRHHLLPCQK